jgi:hypothetical protein
VQPGGVALTTPWNNKPDFSELQTHGIEVEEGELPVDAFRLGKF